MADFSPYDDAIAENSCNFFLITTISAQGLW